MRVSLDTSAYSALDRGHVGILTTLEHADEIILSVIAIAELLSGFGAGRHYQRNRSELQRFLGLPNVMAGNLDFTTADRYAEIAVYLRRQGTPVPTNDILIAAHAMQHGLQVVTLDKHFQAMPQVSIQLFGP